ncbi:NAD(P)/FAD-dependent oxidoreductase [Ktedonosporobacter rubrisoli]|uniref:NAD(P)/FAD-dependent oxidoreductase n=1 Tax=Ktedonosporobacter rubrisoli TaxID=2509675 RepID=A0A4P6K2U9_KTERU|nr:nitrite reductase large subunit NirB [Ktedonosporobacter rubrisoli]QBD82557.1 NAD(P)/FAD-dependent oxidoreductase [Ktedonosporobacter rubrisoli]
MAKKQRLVIIGNGMVGTRLVEEIIARDGHDLFEITMFGAEPYGNYNRILLSHVLAGTQQAADIFLNPLDWYKEQHIQLHAGRRVTKIEPQAHMVYATDGVAEPYDTLIIATGSTPFIPPIKNLYTSEGNFQDGIFAYRSLDDCANIIDYAKQARRAAIIGGGLLGLEAARGLLNRGLAVHVIHISPHLMNIQLDGSASAILQENLERLGICFSLAKNTVEVLGQGTLRGLVFADGTLLECDMCLISAGIRPNVDLAQEAGLQVEKGIVVNDDLSCSLQDIYALGECAQHRGRTYGLLAPLWEQARCLAERLTGRALPLYQGSAESTKLKVMGVELTVMGQKERSQEHDEVVTYMETARGIYKKLILRDKRLIGAILLGESQSAPQLLQLFARGTAVPGNSAELLFPQADEPISRTIAALSDEAQICNCNGVSKGQLIATIKHGKRSLKTLCESTRAGTGCGSCKSQVQALLELMTDGQTIDDPSIHYYVPGVPLTKPQLIAAIREQRLHSVSAVFKALAGGKEDPSSKAGLASLLKTIWGKAYEDERDARFINDRVHANIQNDGTFSIVPRIYGGVTSPAQLRRIADVAEKYKVPMVKITGGQRIDLLGIPKQQLPAIWRELGMPSGHAYTKAFRTCKTCVGSEFCRYGLGDSTTLGIRLEKRFQGLETPHKAKLAVSGCPRNCAESTTKDIGIVAIEGNKWEIYVGGAAGSRVRKGDLLCTVATPEEVLVYAGRFMQYYREQAKYQERTYDFVERLGLDYLRQLLIADAEGICQQLDEDLQAAVDTYVDPWEEALAPATPTQFAHSLEVVEKIPLL